MPTPSTPTAQAPAQGGHAGPRRPTLPPRLLLRFADPAQELRFIRHYVAFYFRYAQASLLLGVLLIAGDYGVDRLALGASDANLLRLTVAVPVLLAGLGYSLLPRAHRHWQAAMAAFIVTVAGCLFAILVRLDAEGGHGLNSWVGVLNFTFLAFYCFVILGVQFRHALVSGSAILVLFEYALWTQAGLLPQQAAYWSYHVLTLFVLAAGLGWWREYVLRSEFAARMALDDSRAAAERRARQSAFYDEVTGLPNRRLFADLAAPALERSRRSGIGCALLHVDLSGLSAVNDVYDRPGGDAALVEVAQRLRAGICGGDLAAIGLPAGEPEMVARLGDSAFSILVTEVGTQERASLIAQRLLAAIAQPLVAGQAPPAAPLVLSAGIGIALFPGDAPDLAGLARRAEQAARVARHAGGGLHRFVDESHNARARARVLLEAELRQAIQAGQLCLHFQPKVDARSGRLVGSEALVRWQHPERGLLLPGSFIGLAEDSGLIGPLTDWVLRAACHCLRQWSDQGLPAWPVSVNLPASSLADAALPDRLEDLLRRHGLHPSCLVLEMTETMVMREVDATVAVLDRLRARGFGLSLDDFGTGYSSLSHLKRLPMSELKIDRSFIADLTQGGREGALAASIITLGSELGMQVVAEGVETAAQAAFLIGRGCVLQQGFLFSRPLPPAAFEALLRAGSTRRSDAEATAEATPAA